MSSSQKHASGTATGAPAPKRMRVSRACEQCRSRKAKCDGTQPECSTCISLGQACSYGPPPKKRGLPPGSFSMLERTVKLFEKLLGLLFINVPGSDEVVLSLVQNYGKSLIDEEDEGEALTKAWKEGTVLKALEALQADNNNSEINTSKKLPRKSISSSSPGLETAQRLFKDASKTLPKPKEGATPLSSGSTHGNQRDDSRRSFNDQFADVDWMGDIQQNNNTNNSNNNNNNAEYDDTGASDERDDGDEEQIAGPTPPITIDPLLMNSSAGYAPAPSIPTSLDAPVQTQMSLTSPPPNLAPISMPQASLMSPPQTRRASQLVSLPTARLASKPDFPPNSKSLLDLYFSYTHSWFPILDKYDIIRLFHANKDRVGGSVNTTSGNDTKRALLYAVLAVASLQRESLPTKSRRKAELVTDTSDLYLRSQSILFTPGLAVSLESVQTLLLLSLVNISQAQLSTAWLFIGLAGRIAIELGIDDPASTVRSKSRFAARAWLGYIVLEVFISNRLDREPQLCGVEWPLNGLEVDGWEEWDSWKDVPVALTSRDEDFMDDDGRPAHILSVFNQLIAISKHVYDVSRLKSGHKDKHQKPQGNNIFVGLQNWVRGLPENFALNSTHDKNKSLTVLPHIFNLHTFYLNTVIQAHLYAGRQETARSHHPSIPIAVTITLGRLQQLKSKWLLGVAPCTLLHFLQDMTQDPIQDEINSQSRDSATALTDQMKENWRAFNPDTDNIFLLRAVKESTPAAPQDWFEAQLGPMGAALDIARPILNDPTTLVAHSRAEIPIPFSPSHLFSSMGPPKSVSVPSPSALFNLPPSSSRAQHGEQPARPSSAYSSGGGNQFEEPRVTMAAQSSPSAIGIPSNLSQTAPSPDTFDEEMGMLECLPWAQEGIPEFIQNLGYVSGFSPSALQMALGPDDHQQPHQQHQQPQPTHQQNAEDREQQQQQQASAQMPSFLATTSANDVEPSAGEDQSFSRHGLNTVLEQWLGDVYGAGHNVR